MNRCSLILCLLFPLYAQCQEQPSFEAEQQLEAITEAAEDGETTDDSWWQQLEYLKKNRLNLNTANAAELSELQLLSALQVNQFMNYRRLLGNLVSIYELQSVPGWDVPLIQKLLPYIALTVPALTKDKLLKQLNGGNHSIALRYSRAIEKAKGYLQKDSSGSAYAGDPSRLMLRYKYQYKNLMQYGLTLSKDAGEPLFDKTAGFDFYSFHFFAGNMGIVKAVALGDYTINMGQGLIHWQGLAFGKGGAVMHIKRQSAVLRPYNSSGAFYFHRGAAVQVEKNKWQGAAFLSLRKLDAKLNKGPAEEEDFVSSIHTSGYHRTQSERSDYGTLHQLAYGATLKFKKSNWYAGLNMIQYHFNRPIQKEAAPYNLYALTGKHHSNYSIDYGFTFKNMHTFGETAIDNNVNIASINGVLVSVHPKASISLLNRSIAKAYQAFYGNAFTASNTVSNEQGLFAGLSLKPAPACNVDLYADVFHFPWLKYRTDAPSYGKDYFIQISYQPSKLTDMYSRYRSRRKSINQKTEANVMNEVVPFFNRSWRTQVSHRLSKTFSVRHRFELLWYKPEKANEEKGFLAFFDVFYNPPQSRLRINARLQYFESDSYNSRLYAYENDVLYYYAVPVFYDKGTRYYINARYKLSTCMNMWIKWGQVIYSGKHAIGSGQDEIKGNKKSEIRVLLSATF
ncbi:helix-hairpin-helix domain-containing protein [Agriterribacter sp.]|uniref:ComEA family DNA-binding protein n=1 Tax=Agriterribacter sp. TaxID=2821509 RepID=UPI002C733F1F|nr:helix-hairpin-helix domain-containing protein [Agriterribacter sp.]HRO45046.1 helix-hairpin-helix domain-containing protein [Agriterribacter sp.]HRQ15513.1 helix-hairpin-helix domain-containing protein [Agriterribacter sp.]